MCSLLLKELIYKLDDNDIPPHLSVAEDQLCQIICDLFGAGTETTASTLKWSLIYMINNPHIQKQVHREIYHIIGYHRPPSMKDKSSLPYTESCVLETQRMADIIPLGVPHATTEDIKFRGYDIPKGTTVMSNLYSVHRDARVWKDPYTFNPERFLDEDGKVHKREQLIPFSMGEYTERTNLFLSLWMSIHEGTINSFSISGYTYRKEQLFPFSMREYTGRNN